MRSIAAACLLALGCYTGVVRQPTPVSLETTYRPQSVEWSRVDGDNSIEGSALLRTVGGDVRTCAAATVSLIPWSRYAGERMAHLYGSIRSGFNARPPYGTYIRWANDDPSFYESVRSTACDAEGKFVFRDLPDGDWIVETSVLWDVPYVNFRGGPQGGSLMQRVSTRDGKTSRVVLTAN